MLPAALVLTIMILPTISAVSRDALSAIPPRLKEAAFGLGATRWEVILRVILQSGLSLSGGQQQRLCIARAIATEPEVLLLDEPCSALDPIATRRIEELMQELKQHYTIAIVTHNLQQAMRVADKTAFMYVDTSRGGRTGYLVEYNDTKQLFEAPQEEYTKQYITSVVPGTRTLARWERVHRLVDVVLEIYL